MPQYVPDIRSSVDFDSSIDPPHLSEDRINFEFTIVLRLYLEQVKGPKGKQSFMAPDHEGQRWPALSWNPAAWLRFKSSYIKLVLKVWDQAFVLIPPAKYDGFCWPQGGRRRNLSCRLRVKVQDSEKNAHATVRVVRLAAPTKSYFRSDSTLYDSADVAPRRHRYAPEGVSYLGNTPAHEVGHLLGLRDVGAREPKCVEEGLTCYGTNLNDRMNVMGSGSRLELSNALPWLRRAAEHTKWDTQYSEWKADWASGEAQLRGLDGFKVDESHKKPYRPLDPGIIDL